MLKKLLQFFGRRKEEGATPKGGTLLNVSDDTNRWNQQALADARRREMELQTTLRIRQERLKGTSE